MAREDYAINKSQEQCSTMYVKENTTDSSEMWGNTIIHKIQFSEVRVQKKHWSTRGWMVCTLTYSLHVLNPHTHTQTHTQLIWRRVNGHRDRVFPAGLCRWELSALFSPVGLGLSFCSGMAEFNWRTLMHSWIAELLMPWLPLKMGGRESPASVCVCVRLHLQQPLQASLKMPKKLFMGSEQFFMCRLIYKIIGNNNFSRLILG